MSKIGKKLILVPTEVKVVIKDKQIDVSGPNGELSLSLPGGLRVEQKDGQIEVVKTEDTKKNKMLQGTLRQLIYNMVKGVKDGWQKELEVRGTGFRVALEGETLIFNLGFSHPVKFLSVPGIKFEVKENKVTVLGPDKFKVGLIAAKIRQLRPPDHYKGKGVRYLNESVIIKPGKAAKVGAPGAGGGK